MLNIIILGAPGSGKGTQAKKLIANSEFKQYPSSSGLIHISTGDLLREEMDKNTELGVHITDAMNKGEYVSDAHASQLVMNKTHEYGGYRVDGFVFDGFPRTLPQCLFLDRLLASFQAEVNVVINLDVDNLTLIERLLERGKTSARPEDKNKKIIIQRIKTYYEDIESIHKYWSDIIIDINGNGTPEEVNQRIINALSGESTK